MSGYLMDRSSSETERLRVQSQLWKPATRAVLDGVDLARDNRARRGCGGGDVLRLMAERDGERGA